MTRDDAIALFEKRRDAWLAEDMDTYLALFADDLVLETPMGPPVEGHAAYEKMVRGSQRAIRPVSFEFHEIAVDGPKVLAEWTITLAVRADGRELTYRGMSVGELRDGQIVTWREYYDPADLELRPQPAAPTIRDSSPKPTQNFEK
jgi:uncharacterized protein (TIGR02246 family)